MTRIAAAGKASARPGHSLYAESWLGLAAAPTFALMAWISGTGPEAMAICSSVPGLLPVNDMALMYLLMSLFHLAPWLRLCSAKGRRFDNSANRTEGE